MSLSIRYKLFIALAATSMFATLLMAVVVQLNLRADFSNFRTQQDINKLSTLLPQLKYHYLNHGNWNSILKKPQLFSEMLLPQPMHRPPRPYRQELRGQATRGGPPPRPTRHTPPPPAPQTVNKLLKRSSLIDINGNRLTPSKAPVDYKIAIDIDGQTVGWIGLARAKGFSDQLDQEFISSQRKSLYTVAAAVILFALLTALFLARHFVRPVQRLAQSMHELSRGNYAERIHIQRKDELGKLAQDVNLLALSLDKNESLRRQWVADTSHELRTPIAILRGEIEAIRDGICPMSDNVIASLHEETLHLNKLVDDLHTLSLSDAGALNYQMQRLNLHSLLQKIVDDFSTRAAEQKSCIAYTASTDIMVRGDSTRLQQLFYNLIENSLRYTDAPGHIDVRCELDKNWITILIEDTPPAPAGDAIEHLFERFYRTENSRNRKTGGSGLGLAICRNIVEAHQGTIKAYLASSGGLGVRITLPRYL